MTYLFKFLFLLIHIDQEIILKWLGLENLLDASTLDVLNKDYKINFEDFESSTPISLNTLNVVISSFWVKIQDGLTLSDIENTLFFILFIRFIILAIRYNLKTSFYICCIGLFASFLWYQHLVDLISSYRGFLNKIPFLHKLDMDTFQLEAFYNQMAKTKLQLDKNTTWYKPGQMIYYALRDGIIKTNNETGLSYYIDPISLIISKLNEPTKSNVLPIYYWVFNRFIPKIIDVCSKVSQRISSLVAYSLITRIGKRYCPYFIRWHWTLVLMISVVDHQLIYLVNRVSYFQKILILKYETQLLNNPLNASSLLFESNLLSGIIIFIIVAHLLFIILAIFHAICGQYFYMPFFVENVELHVGQRLKQSVYSGGYTAWQDKNEKTKKLKRFFPKIWFGWFGRGIQEKPAILKYLERLFKKFIKPFKKTFK